MRESRIADPDDPRIADYRGVKDPEWVRQRGLFLAEGTLVVRLLLEDSPYRARSLLLTETALTHLRPLLAERELEVFVTDRAGLRGIAGYEIHQGCLALGERPPELGVAGFLAGLDCEPTRVLVLDRVTNPDNIGAAFRNGRAFGVEAIVLGPGCAHPLYRKAIRTSMGNSLRLPFVTSEHWPEDLAELARVGLDVVALTLDPSAEVLCPELGAELSSRRVALLLGHEGDGLGAEVLRHAKRRVRIPIAADVDSLNVATAAAIALHALRPSGRLSAPSGD